MAIVKFNPLSFIIDEDFIIQTHNKEAEKVIPCIQDGKKCYETLYGANTPCANCPLATGKSDNVMHLLPSGDSFFAQFSNITLPDGRDGYIVTNHDTSIDTKKYIRELDLMKKKMEIFHIANYNLAYAYFEVNLSKNILLSDFIEVIDNEEILIDLGEYGFKKPIVFTDFNKWRVERGVKNKVDEYLKTFAPENLIDKFNKGEPVQELTFESKSTGGYDTLQQQTYYMYKSEYDDDIYALGILKDVYAKQMKEQKNKRNEDIMNVLVSDYSSVFYLDFVTGDISICSLPNDLRVSLKSTFEISNYKELWSDYLKLHVKNSDKNKIVKYGDIDYLKEQFKTSKTIMFMYRVGDEYEYKYHEMKIACVGEADNPIAAVIGVADRDKDIKEHQEQQRELEEALQLAQKDSLTGVNNRTAYDFAERELDNDIFNGTLKEYAILMCDINNLKKTNDEYGHEKGNMLVINSSRLLCDIFKNSKAYRIGGDEFIVILKDKDYQDRFALCEQLTGIIKSNERRNAPIYDRVSLASGIAEYDKNRDKSASDVFQRADVLMYKNKAEMKNSSKY